MNKTAVLLIQLGTPNSPSTSDVRRYLSEFLNDPRVIDLPWIARKVLVNGIIVPFRAPKSAKIYQELWAISDNKSPLLTNTLKVQEKLQSRFKVSTQGVATALSIEPDPAELDPESAEAKATIVQGSYESKVDIYMAMRYQNPSIYDVMEEIRKKAYEHIIVLPLFPQYASASSGSAIDLAMKIIGKWWAMPKISIVNQFWDNEGYIDSIVERSKSFDLKGYDHILFSYHGLPQRHVDKVYEGDDLCDDSPCETEITEKNALCYKATSYATTRLIAEKLGLSEGDYTVCFQSRLDKKWLRPFSDHVVEEKAKQGAKKLLAFSPAFVSDCLETLIEIGDEYQEIFESHGGEKIQLVPSSNDHERFIDGLEQIVRSKL